jgi:PAS domain S-box-containing protein
MDREKAELEKSDKIFKTIFEEDRDGMLLADAGTKRFYMCNKMICEMLGYAEKELLCLSVNDIHPEKDLPGVIEGFERQVNREVKLVDNVPVKRKDGSVFYAEINSAIIVLGGKKYILGSFRDVTEHKKIDEKLAIRDWGLQKANEGIKILYKELDEKTIEVERLSKIKSEFTAMVSHELKNPLAVIQECISLVMEGVEGNLNEGQKDILNMAKMNINRLARFINNILDFQQMESGQMKYNIREDSINDAVVDVHKSMGFLTREKGLDFVVRLDDDMPKIMFDKEKIIQVLNNLVSNAIKLTEKGSISIVTRYEDNVVHVVVGDSGPGIKAEDIQKLFQAFEQLDRPRDRGKGGTGLGLVISKKIIVDHKGKIWAESEGEGKGAKFHFTLPARK